MPRNVRLCLIALGFLAACSKSRHIARSDAGAAPAPDGGSEGAVDGALSCAPDAACVADRSCMSGADCTEGERCTPRGVCMPAGTCSEDADCASGTVCSDQKCAAGSACGVQRFATTQVAPNLLLVLDRSCSMLNSISGTAGDPTKWTQAVSSVEQLITSFADTARWGLVLFPDAAARNGSSAQKCADDTFPVPIGEHTGPAIKQLLTDALDKKDPNYPNGPCVTPIDSAVVRASMEPALADSARKSYLVLITDGRQAGCSSAGGEPGVVKTLADLAGKGVDTFVVGFGSGAADQSSLTMFAQAGGTARSGSPAFYDASDGAALEATLKGIVASLVGCDYALDMAPPDTDKLYVFFDKTMRVQRDTTHANGWDFDAKTHRVTLYGGACDALRTGKAKALDIVYGCPGSMLQ